MKMKLILAAVALTFSLSLLADSHSRASEIAPFSATQTVQVTTVVDAVDREARTVTLKGPEGNTRTIQTDPNSNNIDQIEVGDLVDVEFVQHFTIEVLAGTGAGPSTGTMAASARNREGETPAGMEMLTTVTTATVEEINIEENTFKLKWPGGEIRQYEAQEPENLKKAVVGDLVITTYTEAIALKLQEVTPE